MSRSMTIFAAVFGTGLFTVFVLGLTYSISTGFAGFWGGFPIMIISFIVIALSLVNLFQDAVRKSRR